ncbi:transcriptional regulator with XRE-family HTH domain [Streptomyces sp. SAI-135]|uniref:helix-turn-helix domain-containing protein n=1 Tax=unclassified Streptomyces TaxID=2593676 RepID=UPI002473AB85|nr:MULTISPECIES: helix-turn-helix transcriptional regulator [unclassified Streptomyces]MDH6517696.1 transcriptional regulator with XRE-family HTH domain [Streptomyces sp. SAI-090]MDH6618214.1 transcriptional regulator with XRE-family HTH domain [Streptomyces sp. SAI-135]
MSGATGTERTEAFARLLRELKDRSGLSYGTLAKRLHMSTSTLHRYCNGTAVPVEYAPVERLARVCRATPQELVELHRHWILADAERGRRPDRSAAEDPALGAGTDKGGTEGEGGGDTEAVTGTGEPEAEAPRASAAWLRRRRTALIASVAVVAALGSAVYVLRPMVFLAGDTTVPAATGTLDSPTPDTGVAGRSSATPSADGSTHGPSASATGSRPATARPGGTGTANGGGRQDADRPADAVPLTVGVRPYVYENPCSQHFLVDSEPEQVGPPATEQDARRWAGAYGAVSSGEQRIALTVQGTGDGTVVLNALHVRFLTKGAPLAWNDYSMGVGCGGGVGTKSFDIDLDNGSPTVTVKNGQRDFPYKVSESDPEVFYITAHSAAHDVRWDLSLDWSSGGRSGTVHIDDAGRPFRTSADVGRPGYDYPLGGSEWIERVGG